MAPAKPSDPPLTLPLQILPPSYILNVRSLILIDFVVKTWKLLSGSVFKRLQIHWKIKKMIIYICDDLEIFFDDSDKKFWKEN